MSFLTTTFGKNAEILTAEDFAGDEATTEQGTETEQIAGHGGAEGVDMMTLEPNLDPMAAEMARLERLLESNPAMAMHLAQNLSLAHGMHIDQDYLHQVYVSAYDKVLEQGGLGAVFHNTLNTDAAPISVNMIRDFDLGITPDTPRPTFKAPTAEAPAPSLRNATTEPEPEIKQEPIQPQMQVTQPNPFMFKPTPF